MPGDDEKADIAARFVNLLGHGPPPNLCAGPVGSDINEGTVINVISPSPLLGLTGQPADCLVGARMVFPLYFWRRIGIGGGLTTSPLPHHRTYGSRIRRFGRFSILAHAQALAGGSPRQHNARSGTLPCKRHLLSLYDRSGLRLRSAQPTMPSADFSPGSGRITPPSARFRGTPLPWAPERPPAVSGHTVRA